MSSSGDDPAVGRRTRGMASLSYTPSFRSAAAKVNQRQVPTERSGPGNVAFVSGSSRST